MLSSHGHGFVYKFVKQLNTSTCMYKMTISVSGESEESCGGIACVRFSVFFCVFNDTFYALL